MYHKTHYRFPPDEIRSHYFTFDAPEYTVTDRGQIVLMYETTRNLNVLIDDCQHRASLKVRLFKQFTGLAGIDDFHVTLNIHVLVYHLRRNGIDGIVTRQDSSAQRSEIILCQRAVAHIRSYVL